MAEPPEQSDDPYDVPGNSPDRPRHDKGSDRTENSAEEVGHNSGTTDSRPQTDTPSQLADQESAQAHAATNDPAEQLSFKYSDDKKAPGFVAKLKGKLNFKSKIRRRLAIGSLLVAGAGAGGVIGFLSLTSLQVVGIVTNLQKEFSAASVNALGKEERSILNGYIARHVLPGIKSGLCHTTVDATCVAGVNDKGPFGQLYEAWHQQRLETSLAKNYGIVFGKNAASGQLYMTINGELAGDGQDMEDVINARKSIFDVGGNRLEKVKPSEVRRALDSYFELASGWDKAYFRFKYGKLIETKYGVKRCIVACDIRDKFQESVTAKKLAAKVYIIQRVLAPLSESYGLVMQCLLTDKDFCNVKDRQLSLPGFEEENLTPFEAQLQQRLDTLALENPTKLVKVIDAVNNISKNGFANFLIEKALTAVFGEQVGKLGVKAVPVVGWVLFAAQIIHTADKIGPTLRIMSYAAAAAAAVQLYMTYNTVASETKSGHMDATILGSFNDTLNTNLDGSATNRAAASTTPFYRYLYEGGGANSPYRCNDGSKVPAGELVCPEEKLDRGNAVATQISSIVNAIPGLSALAAIINTVNDLLGDLTSGAFDTACNIVNPPCHSVVDAASSKVAQFTGWLTNQLVPSPFAPNMSGGRIFDMMAAGANVSFSTSCRIMLGCGLLSNQQISQIRNEQLAKDKADFDHLPLSARLFSTDTPYSLVSRAALAMPSGNLPTTVNSITASLASNPLGSLTGIISDTFSGNKAFAARIPVNNPFGVRENGYADNQIPGFSGGETAQAYWDRVCRPKGGNTDDLNAALQKIGTDWGNSLPLDENTGEPLADHPEPCLLVGSALQVAGVKSSTALAPANSLNPDPPN